MAGSYQLARPEPVPDSILAAVRSDRVQCRGRRRRRYSDRGKLDRRLPQPAPAPASLRDATPDSDPKPRGQPESGVPGGGLTGG